MKTAWTFEYLFLKHLQLTKDKKDPFLILDENVYHYLKDCKRINSAQTYLSAIELQTNEKISGFGEKQYIHFDDLALPFSFYSPYEVYKIKLNESLTIKITRRFTSPLLLQLFPDRCVSDFNFFRIECNCVKSDYIFPFISSKEEYVFISDKKFVFRNKDTFLKIDKCLNELQFTFQFTFLPKSNRFIINFIPEKRLWKQVSSNMEIYTEKGYNFIHEIHYYKNRIYNRIITNLFPQFQKRHKKIKSTLKELFLPLQRPDPSIFDKNKVTSKALIPTFIFIVVVILLLLCGIFVIIVIILKYHSSSGCSKGDSKNFKLPSDPAE